MGGGGGGVGGGGGGGVERCQVYYWPPFLNKKVYEWPDFSGFLCERPHFSDIMVYAHILRSEIFRGGIT